jgi:hypothetical protein
VSDVPKLAGEVFVYLVGIGVCGGLAFSLPHQMT